MAHDWDDHRGGVSIHSTAIALPTPGEISSDAERLAQIAQAIWDESGNDPRWDGVHIDGAYWIRREGAEIELARSLECGCSFYDWSGSAEM